jgi:hypothetical protein
VETYNEWQQEMAEKMARERAQRAIEMHVAAESVSTELIAEVTADLCRDISRSCIGQEWDARCEEQTADSVLQTLVQAQVVELAEAEHRVSDGKAGCAAETGASMSHAVCRSHLEEMEAHASR